MPPNSVSALLGRRPIPTRVNWLPLALLLGALLIVAGVALVVTS